MYLIALVLFGVVLNSIALVLLKIGTGRMGHFDLTLPNILQIATNLPIITGLFLYAVSVVTWLVVISRMEVSAVHPMMSLGYIATAIIATVWLGEHITPMRIAGIAVIMLGVWMVSRTA